MNKDTILAVLETLNETARRYAAGETASVSERQNIKSQIVRSNRLITEIKQLDKDADQEVRENAFGRYRN